ncbi:hypothetical protein [Streptomyces sp. NPDC047097]|uniref:hypothetical protein n=1 Tax=Streptomyces sp. NPDC047097 TaxID=3155260 RepID=UPI00340F18C1
MPQGGAVDPAELNVLLLRVHEHEVPAIIWPTATWHGDDRGAALPAATDKWRESRTGEALEQSLQNLNRRRQCP